MDTVTAVIVAAFTSGAIVALIAWARFRRRDMAEVAEKLTGIATSMLSTAIEHSEVREQVREKKMERLEAKVAHLERTVDALAAQLREHGITPVFPPMPPVGGA